MMDDELLDKDGLSEDALEEPAEEDDKPFGFGGDDELDEEEDPIKAMDAAGIHDEEEEPTDF